MTFSIPMASSPSAIRRRRRRRANGSKSVVRPAEHLGPYTVREAVADYLDWFRATGRKSIKETAASVNAFILPRLGDKEVPSLTSAQLRKWQAEMAASPPRLRTRPGRPQNVRDTSDDPEASRRRRATANRILTVLKAALNHAWREGKASSDEAWRRVAPFREADTARVRYLDRDECCRLVNACPEPLRAIVRGALLTGARYGELARMRVADFHHDSGTLLVRQSKAGKVRHVELTTEGLGFFHGIIAGRYNTEFLFHREGASWGKSHQQRPLAEACRAATVTPAISFHILRHTYASLMVMDGVPLIVVARNLGHSDTRMVEKHYGHLTGSYIREAIRSAKAIGIGDEEANIIPLAARAIGVVSVASENNRTVRGVHLGDGKSFRLRQVITGRPIFSTASNSRVQFILTKQTLSSRIDQVRDPRSL